MEQKLKITDGNGTNFFIYGSEKELKTFIKWVKDYKHGTCHEMTVTCKTPSDMKACNFKAIRMKCLYLDKVGSVTSLFIMLDLKSSKFSLATFYKFYCFNFIDNNLEIPLSSIVTP